MNDAIPEIITFGEHDWRVLENKDDRALILCEKVINKMSFGYGPWFWEGSEIRKYLNGDFLSNFKAEEKARVAPIHLPAAHNPWFGKRCSMPMQETTDHVFLLSVEQTIQYFGGDEQQYEWWGFECVAVDNKYNELRSTTDADGAAVWWWLRTVGYVDNRFAFVTENGCISVNGTIPHKHGGVRPALWLLKV